jgi:hypothetical protein
MDSIVGMKVRNVLSHDGRRWYHAELRRMDAVEQDGRKGLLLTFEPEAWPSKCPVSVKAVGEAYAFIPWERIDEVIGKLGCESLDDLGMFRCAHISFSTPPAVDGIDPTYFILGEVEVVDLRDGPQAS